MILETLKSFAAFYTATYNAICGQHPHVRPWHFQWLAVRDLYRDLRRILPTLEGTVLDVGCGNKPYSRWLTNCRTHIGIDVTAGEHVDYVIVPHQRWPLETASCDHVFCTQVLEHVSDLDHVLSEIHRTLKPGGRFVVTVPFIYNEHGTPHDYRRFSRFGIKSTLSEDYEIVEQRLQSRAFSTMAVLLLNWLYAVSWCCRPVAIMTSLLLPIWLITCAVINSAAVIADIFDRTNQFYGNVLLVVERKYGSSQ